MIDRPRFSRTSLARASGRGARRSGHRADGLGAPGIGPLGVSLAVTGGVFLLAGILWPAGADMLLRLMLASLAAIVVLVRGYQTVLPVRERKDVSSPFDPHAPRWTPSTKPQLLRKLTGQLEAAASPWSRQGNAIPPTIRRDLREEVSRRVAERHGLRLDQPEHHARIRSIVSEPTWSLIRPRGAGGSGGASGTGAKRPLTLDHLELILDDLERL